MPNPAASLILNGRGWYRDRTDGLATFEMSPNATLDFVVTWSKYTGITAITPQTPTSEGGTVAVTMGAFSDAQMAFTVTGSGATVTFRIAFASGHFDELTLRFRSVRT